jgi:Domain of unknown function (DUF397)
MEDNSAAWRASTYSGTNGGQCTEVGQSDGRVLVRDSKDRDGLVLAFGPAVWREFATLVKNS